MGTRKPENPTEYIQLLTEDIETDNWQMEYIDGKGLVITGIKPNDGQLMLLSDSIARDLLDERTAHEATRAELAKLKVQLAEKEAHVLKSFSIGDAVKALAERWEADAHAATLSLLGTRDKAAQERTQQQSNIHSRHARELRQALEQKSGEVG